MSPHTAAIRARLASVDAQFVSPEKLMSLQIRVSVSPEQFLKALLDTARRNPLQGAASALNALEISSGQEQPELTAAAYLALGISLAWWGYYAEALSFLEEDASDYQPVDDYYVHHLYRRWYKIICERRLHRVDDDFDRLLDIADLLEKNDDKHAAMRCRLDAISTLYLPHPDDEVNRFLREINHYFEINNLPGDLGIGLILCTFDHFNQGDLTAGLDTLNRAEAIFVEQEMPAMLAYAWMYRGVYFYHRRELEEADSWLQKAQHQAAALKHNYYLALILLERARLYFEKGDLPSSLEVYLIAADLSEKQGLIHLDADSQISIANLRLRQGDYEAAVEGYQQAERLFTELDNETYAAIARMNLGVVARRQGDFTRSLNQIRDALEVFQSNHALEHQANAQYNLGKTYAAFGYFEPAIEHYQKNIELLHEAGIETAAIRPSIDLAHIMIQRGQPDRAGSLLDRASYLAGLHDLSLDSALCLRAQADLMVAQGQKLDALQAYKNSQEKLASLQQYETVREITLSIADLLVDLGRIKDAWDELNRLDQKKLTTNAQWYYHIICAKIARIEDRCGEAQEIYIEALRTIRSARRTLLQEEQVSQFNLMLQSTYEDALSLALEQDDPAGALSVVELCGTQLLNIRLGVEDILTNLPRDFFSKIADLLTTEFGQTWIILRYAWFQDRIGLFALTPDGLDYYPIDLDGSMRLALKACTNPDNTFRQFTYLGYAQIQPDAADISRRNLQRLYQQLLPEAIRSRLNPEHTLIVIPTHQLHGLAFQALLDNDAPLIEKTRLLYAQSLELLAASLNRSTDRTPNGSGLILAQPDFTLPGYRPLPHVRLEADTIRKIVGETVEVWPPAKLNHKALSQAALKGNLSRYDWLHIATHSYVEPATGAFAGLVLGSDVLKLEDIHRWQLNARLVTLSACQTGLGRWYYGDEIAGLSQAFLGTGVQAVIASLWLAADQQTADFMAILYEQLQLVINPITALAQAQREAHRSGLAPYYWAPFCVFGKP